MGDLLALFTGATDCTPDGPGNSGLLHFRFVPAGAEGGDSPHRQGDSPSHRRQLQREEQQQRPQRAVSPSAAYSSGFMECVGGRQKDGPSGNTPRGNAPRAKHAARPRFEDDGYQPDFKVSVSSSRSG